MAAREGLRWCFAVLAALAAAAAAGAEAPSVRAGRDAQIVLTGDQTGLAISSGGATGDQSLEVDFQPDKALPKKLVVDVPSGYRLDLAAKPGTTVASASLSTVAVDSLSFAVAMSNLVAKDPNGYVSDRAAQECAPGTHAAVWAASFVIGGQQVTMVIFADPSNEPGVAYLLQSCPSGLTGAQAELAVSISLSGLRALAPPTAAGHYLWHALVTPAAAPTYEMQAVVPLPESISLRAGYERRSNTAVLSGRVIEAGEPVAHADLYLTRTTGNSSVGGLAQTHTKRNGTFTFRVHARRTSDFDVTAAPTVGPCAAPSSAPGGCLAATTVAPDDAFTTVWVSVPGGPRRAYRPSDQRRAEAENLAVSDLPTSFQASPGSADPCANHGHESDLTITGEDTSPTFFDAEQDDPLQLVQASALARVYATQHQAEQAFAREAVRRTARCELKSLGSKPPPLHTLQLPHPGARSRGYRATLTDKSGQVSADLDFVFLQRGRSVVTLRLIFVNTPNDLERTLTTTIATRMR